MSPRKALTCGNAKMASLQLIAAVISPGQAAMLDGGREAAGERNRKAVSWKDPTQGDTGTETKDEAPNYDWQGSGQKRTENPIHEGDVYSTTEVSLEESDKEALDSSHYGQSEANRRVVGDEQGQIIHFNETRRRRSEDT